MIFSFCFQQVSSDKGKLLATVWTVVYQRFRYEIDVWIDDATCNVMREEGPRDVDGVW